MQDYIPKVKESIGAKLYVSANQTKQFTNLYRLLSNNKTTDGKSLLEVLDTGDNFTVFAPTDDAFGKLIKSLQKQRKTLEDFSSSDITNILLYHVLNGVVKSGDINDGATPMTLAQKNLCIVKERNKIFINGNRVIQADVQASNGVIHVIDGVLLPLDDCNVSRMKKKENRGRMYYDDDDNDMNMGGRMYYDDDDMNMGAKKKKSPSRKKSSSKKSKSPAKKKKSSRKSKSPSKKKSASGKKKKSASKKSKSPAGKKKKSAASKKKTVGKKRKTASKSKKSAPKKKKHRTA